MVEDDDLPPEPGEPIPRRASKLEAVRKHIGVKTDREVAELVGLTASAVQMYRKSHGIPSSGSKGGRKRGPAMPATKPAPKATAARKPSSRGKEPKLNGKTWAWRVTLDPDLVRYVVATDAASAAALGDRAGSVLTIDRIGEGL